MTDRSFEGLNDDTRRRLAGLVASLDGAALATDTGEGWSVATVLAHLAYWDRHVMACWRGVGDRLTPEEWPDTMAETVNDAIEPFLAAIPGPVSAALVLEAAAEIDALVAGLSDMAVDTVRAEGQGWMLDAWDHRVEHITQIERGLGRA